MADGTTLFGVSQRLPPGNLQAEQALLGALLAKNMAYERVADNLQPHHFADPVHGLIYRRITERILDGHLADAVSMRADFEQSGLLDHVGGVAYLAQLLSSMVAINMAADYAREIVDCWLRRQLINIGEDIVNGAFGAEPSLNAAAQLQQAERSLADLNAGTRYASRLISGGDAVQMAISASEEAHRSGVAPGLLTGMASLDKGFDGIMPGTLTLLAGLPGSGKTGLVGQLAKSIALRVMDDAIAAGLTPAQAQDQPGVAIFSLEMSAEELGLRLAAEEAGLNSEDVRKGKMDDLGAVQLMTASNRTRFMPLRLYDLSATPWSLLAARIQMHLRRQPELLVIIDHLLVLGEEQGRNGAAARGLDQGSVGMITRAQKAMAKRTGVAMMVLTHTPRPSRDGHVRRPIASDVKWAGEGDADYVVFVHRPIMLMDDQPPKQGKMSAERWNAPDGPLNEWHLERAAAKDLAEIVFAKVRSGPTSVQRMKWRGATTSFSEWDAQVAKLPDDIPDYV